MSSSKVSTSKSPSNARALQPTARRSPWRSKSNARYGAWVEIHTLLSPPQRGHGPSSASAEKSDETGEESKTDERGGQGVTFVIAMASSMLTPPLPSASAFS